jgi:hypothetical protein
LKKKATVSTRVKIPGKYKANLLCSSGGVGVSNHRGLLGLMLRQTLKTGTEDNQRGTPESVIASELELWDISIQWDLVKVGHGSKQDSFLGWVLIGPVGMFNLNWFHFYSNCRLDPGTCSKFATAYPKPS